MKHPLRLLVGIPLLLLPVAAGAVDCGPFDNAQAISQHYVQKVLDRADDGIEYANESLAPDDFFPLNAPFWARSIAGTLARVIDSRQHLSQRTEDLETATACLRYDQILIECKMEKVREELDKQYERGSFFGIMQLQSLMLFLQGRYAQLTMGSADGSYADRTWEGQRIFDREPPEALDEPLCPFHSDYTPPRMTGYGCDATILAPIVFNTSAGMPFAEAELQGLKKIEEQIDEYRKIIPLLQSATDDSNGSGGQAPGPVSEREHKTIIGCQERLGVCSGDDLLRCGSNEFCASKDAGDCIRDTSSPTIAKRSLRGPFSYPTDHLTLLEDFLQKRIDDGLSRTTDEQWTRTEDLPANGSESSRRALDDSLLIGARTGLRSFFRSVSGIQGREEGTVFPEATDSQLEIADALSDMRASIGELSRLASKPQGVRAFIIDFAYFLRRTCVFRTCQKSLEQIIRISQQDACFPYTNGEFLGDSEKNPRWKTCALAACIQVDDEKGNPIQLPSNCDEILPPK